MWHKKAGLEHDHVDGRTGLHVVRLHNSVTDGEHLLHIALGVDYCTHCKRPFPKDELGAVDPAALVADALDMLRRNHDAVMEYAAKHRLPVAVGPGASVVPGTHRAAQAGAHKMIVRQGPA